MARSSAHLRKTFQYPGDDEAEEDLEPEALDEEEQEDLIAKFREQNVASNALYTKAFLSLPLLSVLPYLTTLADPRLSMISILSISSLLCTAYILYYFPHNKIGLSFLDSLTASKSKQGEKKLPQLGDVVDKGPIELYLAGMNAVLVGLLAVAGRLVRQRQSFVGFGTLPSVIYVVILVAKVFMASVDVGQLEDLKYGYKGA